MFRVEPREDGWYVYVEDDNGVRVGEFDHAFPTEELAELRATQFAEDAGGRND
jgi:hypothetical protein